LNPDDVSGASVKYSTADMEGNKLFWAFIDDRLGTKGKWLGYDTEVHKKASIWKIGFLKLILWDTKSKDSWTVKCSHIIAGDKIWEKLSEKDDLEEKIVRAYMSFLGHLNSDICCRDCIFRR